MNSRTPPPDGPDGTLSRIRERLASVDRGWKATLVGVAITLLYAAGVV
ncbi:hypothetical protein [Halobellus salinus]|nr:hypothetical protein [Halobellus salinus]